MKTIKLKILGKYSISSILFWLLFIYLIFVIFSLGRMLIPFEKPHLSYDVWSTFKLNVLHALPQLIILPILLLILNVLKSANIFSNHIILYLKLFSVFCFSMPLIKFIGSFLFFNEDLIQGDYNTVLYIFLGVCSIFMLSIFKKGYNIQQENNLTI